MLSIHWSLQGCLKDCHVESSMLEFPMDCYLQLGYTVTWNMLLEEGKSLPSVVM